MPYKSVAGLLRYGVPAGSIVVATLTGNGLKDPDTALRDMPTVTPLPVDANSVVAALKLD